MCAATDLYGPMYFLLRANDGRRLEMMRQETARLKPLLPSRGVVVDVGCGTGEFLSQPFFTNWDRYGVDVSAFAQTMSVRRGISFDLPETPYGIAAGWADLVVMRGFLQHTDDPFGALRDAYAWLKPGGYLSILATPNAASVAYRLFQRLPGLDPDRNYWIPSPVGLWGLLEGLGFHAESVYYPYQETPYARPVRDLCRFLIGRPAAFPGNYFELTARKP